MAAVAIDAQAYPIAAETLPPMADAVSSMSFLSSMP